MIEDGVDAPAQYNLLWEMAEAASWHGKAGNSQRLWWSALLSQMEASGDTITAITYDSIGKQAGRTDQAAFDAMQGLIKSGWVNQKDPGNDGGKRHGNPELPYLATTWATPSQPPGAIVRAVQDRAWDDYEEAQARKQIEGQFTPRSLEGLSDDEREAAIDWATRTAVRDGFLDHFGRPALPGEGWWSVPGSVALTGPPLPSLAVVVSKAPDDVVEGHFAKYLPEEVQSTQRGQARTPLDYMTWSDAFQKDEAGAAGWLLARQQVTSLAFLGRRMNLPIPFARATGAEVGRFLGLDRSSGLRLLQRLVDRGYAKPNDDGKTVRLIFDELFEIGALHSGERRAQLDEQEHQPEYAPPTVVVDGSRFRRLAPAAGWRVRQADRNSRNRPKREGPPLRHFD